MNQNSKNKILSLIIWIIALFAIIKLIWVAISYIYLPDRGVGLESGQIKKTLHYRYGFASSVELPKVVTPVSRPTAREPSIKDIKLVAIYNSRSTTIVTVIKKGKSHVLSKGEEIDGFVLHGASSKEAYFEKSGKRYTLKLFEEKSKHNSSISPSGSNTGTESDTGQDGDDKITSKDGIRQIPRDILKTYTSDISKAMRDIGLRPIRKGDQMQGYKVRFIRKGSPFSKLGLEKGDIIKAINGEDIVDFAGPMELLKNAGTIEGLTITVIRKNEEKELEYEVK